MPAPLVLMNATYHAATSGAATTLAVPSVVVPFGTRLLVQVAALSPFIALDEVNLSGVRGVRIRTTQQHSWRLELWAFDTPATSGTVVNVAAPSAVKMHATVMVLSNAASLLTSSTVKFTQNTTASPAVSSTAPAGTFASAPLDDTLALMLAYSDVSSQTFDVGAPAVSVFDDDSIATTDVHASLATDTVNGSLTPYGYAWELGGGTSGFVDVWSTVGILVAGATSGSLGPPIITGATVGGGSSFSFTAEASKTIYVIIHTNGSAEITGATYNGVAMVRQFSQVFVVFGFHAVAVFSLVGAPAGSHTLGITAGSGTIVATAFNVENGPADGGLTTIANSGATATSYALNQPGWLVNGLTIGYVAVNGGGISVTAGTSVIAEGSGSGYRQGLSTVLANGDTTLHSYSFTASDEFAALGFTIPSADDAVTGGAYQLWTSKFITATGQGHVRCLPQVGDDQSDATTLANHIPSSKTLHVMRIDLADAPGLGNSRTFAVTRHGLDTGMTVTVSGTATFAEVAVDIIAYGYASLGLRHTYTGSPTVTGWVKCAIVVESGDSASSYGGGSLGFVGGTIGGQNRQNALTPVGNGIWDTTGSNTYYTSVVPVPGTFTELVGVYQIEMLAGNTYELSLYKANVGSLTFVKQDGSGGTVDTRMILTGTNGTAGQTRRRALFSLPVVPGDRVYEAAVATAGSAFGFGGSLGLRIAAWVKFVPTTAGQFILGAANSSPLSTSDHFDHPQDINYTAAEADAAQILPTGLPTPLVVNGIIADVDTAPGSDSWRFTTRKNLADGNSFALVTGASVTQASGAGVDSYVAGDSIDVRISGVGASISGHSRWAFDAFMTPPIPSGASGVQTVTQVVALIGYDEDDETASVPPSSSPCTGGGTVDASSNPAAGTSLAGSTKPEFYVEFTVGGTGVTVRASDVTLPDTTLKVPTVMEWGTITRALADSLGAMESASCSIRFADLDGSLKEQMRIGYLLYQPISVYAFDDATRRAGGTPWRVFHGRISNFGPDGEGDFIIDAEDHLTATTVSPMSDEKLIPQRLIDGSISDASPTEFLRDKPVPIIYGSVSDEDSANPEGAVQLTFTNETSEFYLAYGLPRSINLFLLCGHAINQIQNIYVADYISGGDTPTTYIPVPASAYGDWIFAPGQPGWPLPVSYYENDGKRYTIVLAKQDHLASRLAREGKMPMRANVCGIETVGDGSGNVIDSAPLQMQHFIVNFILQNYLTGNWLPIPTSGGYSVLDSLSFAAVKTVADTRLPGIGYPGAVVLGWNRERTQTSGMVQSWCTSYGFELFVNRHGQLSLTMLDRNATASGAIVLNDQDHVFEDTLSVDPGIDQVENEVNFYYKQNYVDATQLPTPVEGEVLAPDTKAGAWASGLNTVQDTAAISHANDVVKSSQEQFMAMSRVAAVANDVAAQRLALKAIPRPTYTFEIPITVGSAIELGDIIKLTHAMGVGSAGITARRLQVRRIEIMLDNFTARLGAIDVHDLLS